MDKVDLYFQRIFARWIAVDSHVIADGCLVVGGAVATEPRVVMTVDLSQQAKPSEREIISHWTHLGDGSSRGTFHFLPDLDLGAAALLPSLVNCHTHLEFSDLVAPLPYDDASFASWIRVVIENRLRDAAGRSQAELFQIKSSACRRGWDEMRLSGTGTVGEILSRAEPPLPYAWDRSDPSGKVRGTIFLEVLGLAPQRAAAAWAGVTASLNQSWDDDLQVGLSPHAPYSTSTWLYQQCVRHSIRYQVPLATHLAESPEETQLLTERSGTLVELFREMGVWQPDQIEARSYRNVLEHLAEVPQLLLIHANYLTSEDWRWIYQKNRRTSVIYCPQTHAYFDHSPHPWPQMAADGLNIALGTDSRASSRTLSLWDDVLLLRDRYPMQDPRQIWQMATSNGARALGCDGLLGTIAPGKLARLLVARLESSTDTFSWEALLSRSTELRGWPLFVRPDGMTC